MKRSKQVISLLLAGQMLGAPLAQAASPSPAEEQLRKALLAEQAALAAETTAANKTETSAPAQEEREATMPSNRASDTAPDTKTNENGEGETIPADASAEGASTKQDQNLETTPAAASPPGASTSDDKEMAETPPDIPSAEDVPSEDDQGAETGETIPADTPAQTEGGEADETTCTPTSSTEEAAAPATSSDSEEGETPSSAPTETDDGASSSVVSDGETELAPLPEEEAGPMLSPMSVMALDEEEDRMEEAYIGFGYEVYGADKPNADGSPKQASSSSTFESGYAELAVEKKTEIDRGYLRVLTIMNKEPSDGYDGLKNYWVLGNNGKYNYEDAYLFYDVDYPVPTLRQVAESWLGRIPDYQFDSWYISGWGPTTDQSDYLMDNGQPTWKYPIDEKSIMVPLSYCSWAVNPDYRLDPEGTSPADMEKAKGTIVYEDRRGELAELYSAQVGNAGASYHYGNWWSISDSGENFYSYTIPIIAHWKLSNDATLVATASVNGDDESQKRTENTGLFAVGLNGVTTNTNLLASTLYTGVIGESGSETTSFDYQDSGTYYLRVNSDVAGIDPVLLAAEAFRSEDIKGGGVTIKARQAGKEEYVNYTCSKAILNDSRTENGKVILYNNAQYPMRSMWTLADSVDYIPLTRSQAGAEDKTTNYYNEIVVTVTAPDGVSERTYTFFIQRLNDPWVVQNPGNTPYGMIARDDVTNANTIWNAQAGMSAEEAKEEARKRFRYGYGGGQEYFFNEKGVNNLYPSDNVENNNGSYERWVYYPGAWDGDSVDLDENAIVVYQDSSFVDPGFTIYDSQGERVTVDPEITKVKRSVVLRVSNFASGGINLEELKDDGGKKGYYVAGTKGKIEDLPGGTTDVTFQIVRDADGKDRIDLRGAQVLPGVYEIQYQFTDPLSEWTYNSTAADKFVDSLANNAATFRRTLVVLPILGDVDMDGAVTAADAEVLQRAIDYNPLTSKNDVDFLNSANGKVVDLFRLRVCDVNNDGRVDQDDVDMIRGADGGCSPLFLRNGRCEDYFYIPLKTGLTAEEEAAWRVRPTFSVDAPDKTKGVIELEFLGLNTGEITADPTKLNDISAEGVSLKEGDIFWVGVKVSDLKNLPSGEGGAEKAAIRGGIASISLSIAYDSRYVAPVALPESDDDTDSQWIKTIETYNIKEDTTNTGKYYWPNYYEVEEAGSQRGQTYTTHYSKTRIPGETDWDKYIRQMTVALRSTGNTYRVLYDTQQGISDDQYLLRVPFQLIEAPFEATKLEALELGLGMQDFNLFSVLIPEDTTLPQTSAAWSQSSDGIFGGGTWNLADELVYVDGSARAIPLVPDTGEKTELVNQTNGGETVYGEPYTYYGSFLANQPASRIRLPEGLTYNLNGTISGTPAEVGRFVFQVQGGSNNRTTCVINVEKAPLTLTAVGQTRYYGEPNEELDYQYNTSEIKDLDKPGGGNYETEKSFQNDGSSTELAKLAGYAKPQLTTNAIQGSDVGEYSITVGDAGDSGLENYYFVYANGTLDENGQTVAETATSEISAQSPLVVEKRPLEIEKLNDSAMTTVTVRVDQPRRGFEGVTASYQEEGRQDFTPVDLSETTEYAGRLTGTPVYNKEEVTVSFTATLPEWDNRVPPYYDIDGASETKKATISDVVLTETEVNKNYQLIGLRTTTADAIVKANPVVKLEVENPPKLVYTYNDKISFSLMTVVLTYDDGTKSRILYSGENSFTDNGILVTWVTPEEKNEGKTGRDDPGRTLNSNDPMFASIHNGKYLCVSAVGYKDGKVSDIAWYSSEPFQVSKRVLTLRVQPLTVYYGEFDDSMLDFTYDPTQLAQADYDALKEALGTEPLGATSAELAKLTNYVAPELSAWTGNRDGAGAERVTKDTDVLWSGGSVRSYRIYIENEKDSEGNILSGTPDYSFRYVQGSLEDDNYGLGDLTIQPRPIVVSSVTLGEGSKAFLYDDTRVTVLKEMFYPDEEGVYKPRPVTVQGENADTGTADTFVAAKPSGGVYYTAGSSAAISLLPSWTGNPVYTDTEGRQDQVVVTYEATYTVDNATAAPPSTMYFEMNGQAEKTTNVTIRRLSLLPGEGDNANYVLVFDRLTEANSAMPKTNTALGLVKMRPIEEVSVSADPSRSGDYIYGQQLNLSGMTLALQYVRAGDNAPAENQGVISRSLRYQDYGDGSDSFGLQGLSVYWLLDDTLEIPDDLTASQLASYLTSGKLEEVSRRDGYPDVAKSGKRLVVCGRRYSGANAEDAGHTLVWAAVSDSWDFQMKKKTLLLTVEEKDRFYGEPNGTFQATYLFSALAVPDQKALTDAGITADAKGQLSMTAAALDNTASVPGKGNDAKDVSTFATSPALEKLNEVYETTTNLGVRFVTAGTQAKDVGTYSIECELSQESNLANYDFAVTPAKLRVFRRPIVVSKICQQPVSNIYENTPETQFPAFVEQTGQAASPSGITGFYTILPTLDNGKYESNDPQVVAAVNSGMVHAMGLSGNAIYGSDTVGLNMTVVFPAAGSRNPVYNGGYQALIGVTIKDLVLNGESDKNYYLVYQENTDDSFYREPVDNTAKGQLDMRPITKIEVIKMPKMEYVYGETLDLSELRVRVTYKELDTHGDSYPLIEDLSYHELVGRLAVNYWGSPTAPGKGDLPLTQWPAASGDHLTIAPSHDDPSLSHNNKYLVLYARTDPSMGYEADAVVVCDAADSQKPPVQLKVAPLDLTYTLQAEDKTYAEDGYASLTAAKGSITLTNPYTTTRTVAVEGDGTATENDRDLIYVTTNVTYTDEELKTYLNGKANNGEAYTFSASGAPGSAGLAFDFYDGNVVYYGGDYTENTPVAAKDWAAYWNSVDHGAKTPDSKGWDSYGDVAPMPVLVSGLLLAGPDKDNYTLDGQVGLSQNADAAGGKDSVPYAAIQKAARPVDLLTAAPQVSVDAHSNAVQITYDVGIGTVQQAYAADQYNSELHYEYGLESWDSTPSDPGGPAQGMQQWEDWSDLPYYGGERMEAELPAGYEPTESGSAADEEEEAKGQSYPWEEADTAFGTRTPLERDTVYWGMVRLAETHNYLASEAVHAVKDPAAETAAAQQAAAEMSELVQGWVETKPEEGGDAPLLGPAAAAKTYKQSFKLLSTEEKTGQDNEKYSVDTLEAVWFTDIQQYPDEKLLDAVLRNQTTTRYYGYYWDQGHSAEVEFETDEAQCLDLSQPLTVEVERKDENGAAVTEEVTVNENASATLYVGTRSPSSGSTYPDKIDIIVGGIVGGGGEGGGEVPSVEDSTIYRALGDEVLILTVAIKPSYAVQEGIAWTSSDPRVATVDSKGRLILFGVGRTEITATTRISGKTATLTVNVSDPRGLSQGLGEGWLAALELAQREENRFEFYFMDAFFSLDEDNLFHPEWYMTRGELVTVLAPFYQESKRAPEDEEMPFPDLTGEETYLSATEQLTEAGVIEGLPGKRWGLPGVLFGGEEIATRGEAAAILCRMMGLEPVERDSETPLFRDLRMVTPEGERDHWASGYINALTEAGAVLGTGDGYFNPDREITRAEVAAMVGRVLLSGTYYDGKEIVPSDVAPEYWAYGQILRCVNHVVPKKK